MCISSSVRLFHKNSDDMSRISIMIDVIDGYVQKWIQWLDEGEADELHHGQGSQPWLSLHDGTAELFHIFYVVERGSKTTKDMLIHVV